MEESVMTKQLSLVSTEIFENNQADFYSNDENYFMTVNQLATCLGYASTAGIKNIIKRNEYLDSPEFSTSHNLCLVEGSRTVTRNIRLFNEDGIYEIAFLSKTAVAQMFRAWVRKILKELRKQAQNNTQHLTTGHPILEQNILALKQTQNQLIQHDIEYGYRLGSHSDRLEILESRPVIDAELVEQVNLVTSNYMNHPVYQRMFAEIVKMEGRYYQLKQENKAIRTALNLHYKEHNPEAYAKPNKPRKITKPKVTYFQNVETLFNDMKDDYQSFTTLPKKSSATSSVITFRILEIGDNGLHFQVTKYNKSTMDVYNIAKAEKRIVDDRGTAEYRIYCDGEVESVDFVAVPKRIVE